MSSNPEICLLIFFHLGIEIILNLWYTITVILTSMEMYPSGWRVRIRNPVGRFCRRKSSNLFISAKQGLEPIRAPGFFLCLNEDTLAKQGLEPNALRTRPGYFFVYEEDFRFHGGVFIGFLKLGISDYFLYLSRYRVAN